MHDWFFLTFIVTSGIVGAAIFAISALLVYVVKDWAYGLVFDGDGPGDAGSPIQMQVKKGVKKSVRGDVKLRGRRPHPPPPAPASSPFPHFPRTRHASLGILFYF